jgi:hypothetical protein
MSRRSRFCGRSSVTEPTPEQKQLTVAALESIAALIRRGMFAGADANDVNKSLNFLAANIALMSGPTLVPEAKSEQ